MNACAKTLPPARKRRRQLPAFAVLVLGTSICVSPAIADGAAPPFKVSHGFSKAVQKYSGLNWLTNATLSGAASLILSARTGGWVHARIRSYGFTDLLDGEFQSVEVTANGGNYKGVPFGHVHLVTANPFKLRYLQRRGHNNGLRTPLLVNVDGDIDETALSKAMRSSTVTDNLRFLKFELPGLGQQHLQVVQPQVELVGDKVRVNSFLVTAGAPKETGIKLQVTARPVLDRERYIRLTDMDVQSADIQQPQNFGPFAEQLFNPLVDFGHYDRFTHAFRMSKFEIGGDRVRYAGRLLLVPKPTSKPTFSAPFTLSQPH